MVYGLAMIVLAAAMLDREAKDVAARTEASFAPARRGGDAA